MKKIMYILIGLLLASLVYITFLSDIPDINIPETVIAQEYEEENYEDGYVEDIENEGTHTGMYQGYRRDKTGLGDDDIGIGKENPMYYKREVQKVEDNSNISGNPSVGGLQVPNISEPVGTPGSQEVVIPQEEIQQTEPIGVNEPIQSGVVVGVDNDEIKEVIASLDKEDIKKTFKPIEIHDFMKSFNKEVKMRDEIQQVVELTYSCEKCDELFILPLDTKTVTMPKVYGEKESAKNPIYTGMDIVLKENEGFVVYSKSNGVVKSIEVDKEKGCGVVIIEQENQEIIYEHLSQINDDLELDMEVKEGQIIGVVKAQGSPKGLNYNIKVDMGGYRVNSNVFIVTEEQEDNR